MVEMESSDTKKPPLPLSPLLKAAEAGDLDGLRLALDQGADVLEKNERKETALHIVASLSESRQYYFENDWDSDPFTVGTSV
jgi:hypothetical protein